MPPKKAVTTSPYFKSTPTRKSTRASTASSTKKRQTLSSDSEFDNGDASESDFESSRRSAGNGRNKRVKVDESSELEVSNEEEGGDDDSNDESKRPKTVIIPLPKARDEGDTPYEDGRIHNNTMLFLKDLKANNDREWLRFNDEDFRASQKDFASFIEELSPIIAEKDFTIPELPSKDIIFRIYRDVRFSNDKTPYKPHFSAAWSRTGRKGAYAAYYLHIQPNGHSFIGGGLWHPEASSLERLRDDIDQNPHVLKRALMGPKLRKEFFKGSKDEKAVVEAFAKINAESALKTKPRGYEVDHQDIKLLRLRNFTISKKLQDSEITRADFLERISDIIASMVPFITYLNSVVRPDRNTNANPTTATANAATTADSSDSDHGDDLNENGDDE